MNKPLKTQLLGAALAPAVTPPASIAPTPRGVIETTTAVARHPLPEGQRPVRVMLALPSGRTWEARTATSVTALAAITALNGVELSIVNLEGSMITKQRNDLVDHAKKLGADYVFFIDTDLVMPPDTLIRLLKHGKDVVGATYNKRVHPYETLGRLKGEKPTDDELRAGGLREAELLPGGCVLVKMSVYDKLTWPFYHESYQWEGADGVAALKEFLRNNYATFAPEEALAELDGTDKLKTWLNETWKLESVAKWQFYSEDLAFFRKLAKAGIKAWCDLDITFKLEHLGTLPVTCKSPSVPTVIAPAVM